MQNWETDEVNFLSKNLELSTKELYLAFCDQFGNIRSYNSLQKKVKKMREAFSSFDDEEAEELVQEEDLLENLQNSLRVSFTPSFVKKEQKQSARDWLEELVAFSEELKDKPTYWKSGTKVNSNKTSLCVLLSDTHFGKHTRYFNLEEACRRMESIPDELKKKSLPELDEIVVILAGDMIEGEDIYPTQNNHIECSAIEQVQVCSESIWKTLLKFRELFDCPVRIETCPGNHGRVSKTANEKTNWDNVVYHLLRVLATMHDDKDLVIHCNFERFKTFKVKDKTIMIYHHGVKHTGTSNMREKVAGWIASKNFDLAAHGHWHEWHVGNWLGKFVVGNGCMCGADDLSEEMGKEDDARQAFWLITPGEPIWGHSFVEWKNEEL